MKPPPTPAKTGCRNSQRPLPFATSGLALGALGGCYILIWLHLEPSARYHASAPVFFLDYDFFRPCLRRPGGLLEYAGGFLAQLDYRPWLGALVFAVNKFALLFHTTGETRDLFDAASDLEIYRVDSNLV
jgi:hypothetical protein